ncbi:MAG: hypothetical protein H0V07_01935 [Propionibacteriales bacterium]|nr:hypothetical protein [Propionibacteriales bacterium]
MKLAELELQGAGDSRLLLEAYRGRVAVLLLGNRGCQSQCHRFVDELRADPDTREVPILQIAFLKGVPAGLWHFAKREIVRGVERQRLANAAQRERQGLPPVDEENILPVGLDWSGTLCARFNLNSRTQNARAVVVDRHGSVVFSGDAVPHDDVVRSISVASQGARA